MSNTSQLELLFTVTNNKITTDSLYFLLKNETVESTVNYLNKEFAPSNKQIVLEKFNHLQKQLKNTVKSAVWTEDLEAYSFISQVLKEFNYPIQIVKKSYAGFLDIIIDDIVVDVTDCYEA